MLERLTQAARETVVLAECDARELGSDQIGADHLLLALASASGDPVGRLLAEAGLDEQAVRSYLAGRAQAGPFDDDDAAALRTLGIDVEVVIARLGELEPGQEPRPTNNRRGRLRMSRGARATLQHAVHEAMTQRSRQIGTDHLLLGLLRSGDPDVAELLTTAGTDPDRLRLAVLSSRGSAA